MKRKLRPIFTAMAFVCILLGGMTGPSGAQPEGPIKKVKVALVLPGPVGDAGWNLAHLRALKALNKALPYVETHYTDSVPEGAEAERVFATYARKGYHVIIAGSFGYMDPALNMAKKFPKVVMMHCCGYKTAPNMATYYVRDFEVGYLAGILAGRMTKKNIIGFVGSHPIPNIVLNINAFAIGVRSVNPKAKVHLVWIQSWYNPAKEREAAESVLDVGADVVAQYVDSPAVQQVAEKRGAYSIGIYSDMSAFAPKAHLTSQVWNWGAIFNDVVKRVHEGTWKNDKYLWGLKEGAVELSPFSQAVPPSVRQLIEQRTTAIKEGRLNIFTGPIRDQKGAVRVPAGKKLSYLEAWKLGFLVEGFVGKLPK
ncbi:MAG: BMP family ABC transporter substrate-binding protein [Nitrospinota bacterium]